MAPRARAKARYNFYKEFAASFAKLNYPVMDYEPTFHLSVPSLAQMFDGKRSAERVVKARARSVDSSVRRLRRLQGFGARKVEICDTLTANR